MSNELNLSAIPFHSSNILGFGRFFAGHKFLLFGRECGCALLVDVARGICPIPRLFVAASQDEIEDQLKKEDARSGEEDDLPPFKTLLLNQKKKKK